MIGNGFGDNNVSFQSYYLVVRLGREPHGLDRAVVEVETELDALVEGELRLPRAVDVRVLLGLHPALVVVQRRLDHSVTDRLHMRSGRTLKIIIIFYQVLKIMRTLAMMYSASSGLSKLSLLATSER